MKDALAELTRSLHSECPDIDGVAELVSANEEAIKQIIDGLTFTLDTYRYNCNNILLKVVQNDPGAVYPYWKHLVDLLESSNTYHRCSAINVLPYLIPVDGGKSFERIFDDYFAHLDDASVIPPCYIARNCPIIASCLPKTIQKIVDRLLAIGDTHHRPDRKDLIKADIILALDKMYGRTDKKAEVRRFVEEQLHCSSPKTRRAAKMFLEKHGDS